LQQLASAPGDIEAEADMRDDAII
jgi:hypothetical protein